MHKYCRQTTTKALQEEKNWISQKVFRKKREFYVVSKFYTRNLLKAVQHKKYIFHDLNCNSKLLIYLMECRVCHIQYIGKSEAESSMRLSNLHKEVNRQNAPQAYLHFKLPYHNFSQHARFILTEQLDNMKIHEDLATLLLKKH